MRVQRGVKKTRIAKSGLRNWGVNVSFPNPLFAFRVFCPDYLIKPARAETNILLIVTKSPFSCLHTRSYL
jgi:hypothetical protein